ncbi:MAG: helix-turn-helix domain-containing protein [Planctomycetota bacterium]
MPQNQPVQSVLRAIDILGMVAANDGLLNLTQVAERTGLNRSTATNLVRTLVSRDVLSRTSTRANLRLGPAIRDLVTAADARTLIGVAGERLTVLAGRHPGYAAVLTERVGGQVRMLLRTDPRFPDRIERPLNETLNPYTKAQSLVFLAFGHESAMLETRQRFSFNDYAKPEFSDPSQLDAALARARRLGYVCPPIQPSGMFRVGCPVFDRRDTLVASVGFVTLEPPPESERGALIADVLEAARDIGAAVSSEADAPGPPA